MTTRLEKPLRRAIKIHGLEYVVEISPGGIMFRPAGARTRAVLPWFDALARAEFWAGREIRRQQLRKAALGRAKRAQ